MAYGDKVLEHYENPRNVGTMDKNDPNVGTGLVGAPDDEQSRLRITEARDRLPPVLPVAKLTLLVSGDAAAIGAQPRAARTPDDGVIEGFEGSEQSVVSRSRFPP